MKQLSYVMASLALVTSSLATAQEELPAVDRPAPIFRLPVYNADKVGSTVVGLDRLVGPDATEKDVKAVLLTFMASFCAPCKKEMPYLQSLHEKYKDFGLRVVSVSIDTEPEGQKIIDDLIAQNHVTYPVLKDRFNLVARRWLGNQSPLPSVFMVRPDGTVSMVHRGYNQEASDIMNAEVASALGIKIGPAVVAKTEEPAATGEHGAVVPAGGTADSKTTVAGGTQKATPAADPAVKPGKKGKKKKAATPAP